MIRRATGRRPEQQPAGELPEDALADSPPMYTTRFDIPVNLSRLLPSAAARLDGMRGRFLVEVDAECDQGPDVWECMAASDVEVIVAPPDAGAPPRRVLILAGTVSVRQIPGIVAPVLPPLVQVVVDADAVR